MIGSSDKSRKEILDNLLTRYKAQPVGSGYIDIIVRRENYRLFLEELLQKKFIVTAISWWEYIESLDRKSFYGLGGPKSIFYEGWFAEVCKCDGVPSPDDYQTQLNVIIHIIENKQITLGDSNIISYKNDQSLTPAFWIDVDENWENVQQSD